MGIAKAFVQGLAAYIKSRTNIHCTTTYAVNLASKVVFTEIPVYSHNDINLAFGDYVEV
jgi:hypothetical protein